MLGFGDEGEENERGNHREEATKKWGPDGSSGQNGEVARGVQEMEGRNRALCLGFQERMGFKVNARERLVAFIPEYGADLMNRLKQGNNGKIPYERIKGKKPSVARVEFGEKVLCRVSMGSKSEKINAWWAYGIFVGGKEEEWRDYGVSQARGAVAQVCDEDPIRGPFGEGIALSG